MKKYFLFIFLISFTTSNLLGAQFFSLFARLLTAQKLGFGGLVSTLCTLPVLHKVANNKESFCECSSLAGYESMCDFHVAERDITAFQRHQTSLLTTVHTNYQECMKIITPWMGSNPETITKKIAACLAAREYLNALETFLQQSKKNPVLSQHMPPFFHPEYGLMGDLKARKMLDKRREYLASLLLFK